ncbi:ABC transporter permease [Croceibacterium sp. TMG7-5b_MA50]|uniref:ABC transporter permease n=1 Tax=Croceibacterium sp. TMG7-5b_MA50 TaxID=3121290 RepID=UPI003221C040
MREWADYSWQDGGEQGGVGGTLVLTGPLLVSSVGPLDRELRELDRPVSTIDLSATGQIDTVGAWTVLRLAQQHDAEITGAGDQASRLLDVVRGAQSGADIRPPREGALFRSLDKFGRLVSGLGHGSVRVIGFLGAIIMSLGGMIRHPRRIRGRAIVRQMELVGVASLPIIGLMSFLIGIVIAQQGAAQLSQFGAEALAVNLVGRLTLRELGVLMTAIMVAGRSGSAFAAQLGTMKLTEEIDAMRTIGVNPMEALIVPRILASVLMMPLLGFYASVIAILGGAVISDLTLGVPAYSFLMRIREVVPVYDLYIGLIKAPVFGLIVALAGCYQGMQVEGNAEEVGLRTTQAVVQAIFMVIVLDAFFAVFFSNLGWN